MLKARLDLEHQVKYTEEAVHIEHEPILLDKVFEDRYIRMISQQNEQKYFALWGNIQDRMN